ncbi:MAG: valine--tRNA ligase [Mycoplasmatales bacterium]
MESKYNHKEVEDNKNKIWIEQKVFYNNPSSLKTGKNFSIILPPPNVTGKLHLGHAWDGTLQDILIRYKKMQGYNSVWFPGMDHAGIATQAKVENLLYEQGISKHELGREKFLTKTWEWKTEYAQHIRDQWGKLGLALDYDKEKFTLDEDCHEFVNKVFVKLYEKDLIYQGYRITNWDPKAMTALSDIEVIHKEVEGAEHYFKYINAHDQDDYLQIMTTRPETMFGDGALAVHPDDKRYNHLVGQEYIVPNTNIKIPVILDEYVAMDKGSGVVKITMAHDPNDFEVAKRHNLKPRIIMNEDGTMANNEYVPEAFQGLDRFEARKKQISLAKEHGLLLKVEKITHAVGHSERSGAVIEPLLSKQWYIKMDKLAQDALNNQQTTKKVEFFPERFENTFNTWMENIHDWCISRQLWWGHQIPAWYKDGEVYVGEKAPTEAGWVQDDDVLDTWFSSGLWPMIVNNVLAKDNNYMQELFPHSVLVTGYDIIFFWVSRMIFQALDYTGQRPFDKVLIHGLVRDEQGKKMSKSLGNGIDPMEVIEQYGADSLRYFLTTNSTPGQDLRYSTDKIESSWNFLNKLWNISRYVLSNSEDILTEFKAGIDYNQKIKTFNNLTTADKYILDKLNITITYIKTMMEKFEFTEVGAKLSNFIWEDFASWYLEVSKTIIQTGTKEQQYQTRYILMKVLIDTLKLLHPFTPFITEEIYTFIDSNSFIVQEKYPEVITNLNLANKFTDLQEIITTLRNFKAENDIKPSAPAEIILQKIEEDYFEVIDIEILKNFGKVQKITYQKITTEEVYTSVLSNLVLNISLNNLIDKAAKKEKISQQEIKLYQEIERSQKMLTNEKFVANAKKEKLDQEVNKAKKYLEQYQEIIEVCEKEGIIVSLNNLKIIEKFQLVLKKFNA